MAHECVRARARVCAAIFAFLRVVNVVADVKLRQGKGLEELGFRHLNFFGVAVVAIVTTYLPPSLPPFPTFPSTAARQNRALLVDRH